MIRAAANQLIREHINPRVNPAPQVGVHWIHRFINRHKYDVIPQKVLEQERQFAEDAQVIERWYQRLRWAISDHGIHEHDIWNMDETGFQIGVGRDQLVVTRRRQRATYLGYPTNRESATAIEAVSAAGKYIPAFLILTGKCIMKNWVKQPELDPDTALSISPTGYTNDEISLEWIKHFDEYSSKRTVGTKRLLLMDGYGSHHTKQFLEYCWAHDIVPFGLPAHSTHLLQPLDVAVFQPLKHYHSKALDVVVRDGCMAITKLEFLGMIEGIRKQAFKASTIQSGFRKTGIVPLRPQVVLNLVRARVPIPDRTFTPPPPIMSSSPVCTPRNPRQLEKAGDHLLGEVFENLDMDTFDIVQKYVDGAEALVGELMMYKSQVKRNEKAEAQRQARRQGKNRILQRGGVLKVSMGREMVRQIEEDVLKKAEAMVKAAKVRERKQF